MVGKIVALDLGDVWTGVAISDPLQMFARPLTTVETKNLYPFLARLIQEQTIARIVIGYPKTMRGTESEQTKKVVHVYHELIATFPTASFALHDERLSSKRAEALSPSKNKDQKVKAHARAAAFILDSYLQFLAVQKKNSP